MRVFVVFFKEPKLYFLSSSECLLAVPWWFSGLESVLSLSGALVPSLFGELRSHKVCSVAKEKNNMFIAIKKENKNIIPKIFKIVYF